jgi:hypothetical protein
MAIGNSGNISPVTFKLCQFSFLSDCVTTSFDGSRYLNEILGGNARRPMALAGVTVRVTDGDGTNSVEIDMLVTADAITEVPSVG